MVNALREVKVAGRSAAQVAEDLKPWTIWEWDGEVRGKAIHKLWGANLPYWFRTIDDFDRATGVATSFKSVNLMDKTYQTASNLRSLLKRYLNALSKFKGSRLGNVIVRGADVRQKVLRIAIPSSLRYRPTKAQLDVLGEIKRLGDRLGIRVVIEEVRG